MSSIYLVALQSGYDAALMLDNQSYLLKLVIYIYICVISTIPRYTYYVISGATINRVTITVSAPNTVTRRDICNFGIVGYAALGSRVIVLVLHILHLGAGQAFGIGPNISNKDSPGSGAQTAGKNNGDYREEGQGYQHLNQSEAGGAPSKSLCCFVTQFYTFHFPAFSKRVYDNPIAPLPGIASSR